MTDGKEVRTPMQTQPWLAYALAREAQQRQIDAAAFERRLRRPTLSVRQVLGRSIVSIGAWIAAEPTPKLARSR
jgi:hypothetical protein